jgi:hypothetical protein
MPKMHTLDEPQPRGEQDNPATFDFAMAASEAGVVGRASAHNGRPA